jgi:hypothetical protein
MLELVRLITVCLSEQEIRIDRYFSHTFPIQNGLKKRSLVIIFSCFLGYAISKVQVSQKELKLNGLHQL